MSLVAVPAVVRSQPQRCGLCGVVEGNPDVPLGPVRLSWATPAGRRGIELELCDGCIRDVLRRASRDGA